MHTYRVNASTLNLRSTPFIAEGNVITRLPNKELVTVLDSSNAEWYKVSCVSRKPLVEGYVFSKYLQLVNGSPASSVSSIQAVHLEPKPSSRRNHHGGYAFPLSEPDMPRLMAAAANRNEVMHRIVSYLAVDKSARYQREPGKTYCNIYACDYCYLTGAYLPRVWWTGKALVKLSQQQPVEPVYGVTVNEMNANSLYYWLNEWGDDFGWIRTYDLDELQARVNEGRTGVICGNNINPRNSGHICCVIPEINGVTALRNGGKVVCPLTSQAGKSNFQLNTATQFRNYQWWHFKSIEHFGFWYL